MESPYGTTAPEMVERYQDGTVISRSTPPGEPPISVEGQIARDLADLTNRVRIMAGGGHSPREWALARTNLQQALHWVFEARDELAHQVGD